MVVHSRPWIDVLLEACPEAADFRCPLSHVVMFDPVTANDGITYERSAIESWLEAHDTSPIVREGQTFRIITKELHDNRERKAALDRVVREYQGGQPFPVDPEMVEWDSEGLQVFLPGRRSLALSPVESVVPPPRGVGARAVADMTSDLIKIFKVLDPLRGELRTLVNLTPPRIVVIGDESSGKSTVLEQLIRMPLFPRKKTFCTRLPIHVRLRRPDPTLDETACVTMSVVAFEEYRQHGRDAEPEEPPTTIAIAAGYQFVQDKMDELERTLSGEHGGVVADKIIVLDVLHPEVPVIDLIDLPGIVTVNVNAEGKREAVETIISQQIEADRDAGMTSFYLVVVPAGERPNTNGALKYIQSQGLLDRAIGVFTKSDEVRRHDDLLSFITGCDIEDEDDGSVTTAASLGEVKLAKGWTATMLEMPKRMVERENGRKTNYYAAHATERLKKQEEAEKLFFGGQAAKPMMRDLYDRGLAGTGALAAKLTREYYDYSRGEWLQQTLARLLEYELELKSQRALLGATDPEAKDALAAEEVAKTIDDGARLLSQRFVQEVLLGTLIEAVRADVDPLNGTALAAEELDDKLQALRAAVTAHVAVAVESAASFYAAEIAKMLAAKVEVAAPAETGTWDAQSSTQSSLKQRFWTTPNTVAQYVRSLFGTATALPEKSLELHKQVVAQPIVQLGQYPAYIEAVTAVVRTECVAASRKINAAAHAVVDELTSDASLYVRLVPTGETLDSVHVSFAVDEAISGETHFLNALKTAFVRHLPAPGTLQRLLASAGTTIRLSAFEEHEDAVRQRSALEERIARVRNAAKGLIQALDVDDTKPLDGAWLRALLEANSLPVDDPIIEYTPPPVELEDLPEAGASQPAAQEEEEEEADLF